MKLHRRGFLHLTAGATLLPAMPRRGWAQAYPARPVHWIVGFAPGGGNDIVARLMGQWLSERLGRQFVIENRPGASSLLATEAVANAAPDGYTLLLASVQNATSPPLFPNFKVNFLRDLTPIAGIMRVPEVMVVDPSLPAKTIPEFIAYAKANPGKLNMGSAGTGSISHLAGELFQALAGVSLVHVPYRGNGPALTAVLGGQVDLAFPSLPSAIAHIKTAKLRALGVTSTVRSEAIADVPTISEFLLRYDASSWYGAAAPAGTPPDVIDRLNREINAGLADATLKARLAELGGMTIAGSPADFEMLMAEEVQKWAKVIRTANIKVE